MTPARLGRLLREEFDRDNWGDVDPFLFDFSQIPADADYFEDAEALEQVLVRVLRRWQEEEGGVQ